MSHPTPDARLPHFPIPLMATVMGLTGLSVVFMKFQHVFHMTVPIGQGLLYAVTAWFGFLLLMYGAKVLRHREQAAKDWRHPVRVNFFPAISICFLLLAIAYGEMGRWDISRVMWWIGAPLHLILLLHILYRWFHQPQKVLAFNPAWFIPVVGPVLVPVAGVTVAPVEISWFFFAAGLVYWIVLLSVFLNRVLFHEPMAKKLLPTLFILIAPPAVGFIAYVKLTGSLDPFARILFHFGIFTFLMLLTMADQFRKVPFFVSWWAYTFPLAAFTLSNYMMFKMSGLVFFKYLAGGMTGVTALVILIVLVITIRVAVRGGICVPED